MERINASESKQKPTQNGLFVLDTQMASELVGQRQEQAPLA